MNMSYIIGPDIALVWPRVKDMIERACDITLTPGDVYESIANRTTCLWLLTEDEQTIAAMTTQTKEHDGHRWVEVMTIGGERFAEWSGDLQGALERYCKQEGADSIRTVCRGGMAKWLKTLGWKQKQIIMEWTDGR